MKAFIEGRGPELARLLVEKARELGFDADAAVRTTTIEGFFVEPEIRDALASGSVKPLPSKPGKPTNPGRESAGGNRNSPQRSSRNKSQEVRNA